MVAWGEAPRSQRSHAYRSSVDAPERFVELSAEELAAWEKTGELPATVGQRFAALGCKESRG